MRLNPFRRRSDKDNPGRMDGRDLWWVRIVLNVGRPLVAVAVLVMCAPGEHYLATLAHWDEKLAWGMPTVLTAYAGIAAVVATKRPKGAPGKRTAVAGAIVSVGLAMAAQPIAHLYGYRGLTTSDIVLITVVSCIPAAVFGHLLHMAAVPGERVRPAGKPDEVDEGKSLVIGESRTGKTSVRDLSAFQVEVQGSLSEADARTFADLVSSGRTNGTAADPDSIRPVVLHTTEGRTGRTEVPVRRTDDEGFTTWHGVSGDAMSWTPDSEPDGRSDRTDPDAFGYDFDVDLDTRTLTPVEPEVALSGTPTYVRSRAAEALLSGAQADGQDPRPSVIARPTPVGRPDGPADVVRRLRAVYPDMSKADIKKRVREELPTAKADSISRAIRRAFAEPNE